MTGPANPPAFPVSSIDGFTQHGMDLRDWFAGQALNGMGTWCPCGPNGYAPDDEADVRAAKARWAFDQADAMLAARGQGK